MDIHIYIYMGCGKELETAYYDIFHGCHALPNCLTCRAKRPFLARKRSHQICFEPWILISRVLYFMPIAFSISPKNRKSDFNIQLDPIPLRMPSSRTLSIC